MTSRWWQALGAAVLAVAVGAAAAGCDRDTSGPTGPPVPTHAPQPLPPAPVVAQGCDVADPVNVPVNHGWESTYTICRNFAGTQAVIKNISVGVLRVDPGRGFPTVRSNDCDPATDLVATVVNQLVPLVDRTTGSVLVRPGGCAVVSWRGGAAFVGITLDYTMSGTIFLASSLAKYAMNKVKAGRTINFVSNIKNCATGATALWGTATGSAPPAVPTVLSSALDTVSACAGAIKAIDIASGLVTEARTARSEWITAAAEISSELWLPILQLAITNPNLLNLLP